MQSIQEMVMEECERYPPSSEGVSTNLKNRMERCSLDERETIVSLLFEGVLPLVKAAANGNNQMVIYLLTVCNADIEDKSHHDVTGGPGVFVSPLWAAADKGRHEVVQTLKDHGANVNSVAANDWSGPLHAACANGDLAMARLLLRLGADVNMQNEYGLTCLMTSTKDPALCELLLDSGALLNLQDQDGDTALDYAIMADRVDTTKVLLERVDGERFYHEAIQTACCFGAVKILDHLLTDKPLSPTTIIHAHELMGTTWILKDGNYEAGKICWRKALSLREEHCCPKSIDMAKEAYDNNVEFKTMDELENISFNQEALRMQALIITERILGQQHITTLSRLSRCARQFGLLQQYRRSIHVQKHILNICLGINVLSDTMSGALRIFIYFMMARHQEISRTGNSTSETSQLYKDAVEVFALLSQDIKGMRQRASSRKAWYKPNNCTKAKNFDTVLKCLVHLIYLMVTNESTQEDMYTVRRLVLELVKARVTTLTSNDSLLHLCLSEENHIYPRHGGFLQPIFPSYDVAKVLLHCGAEVNEKNMLYYSPLRLVAEPENYSPELVKLLLRYSAHVDQPDHFGDSPATELPKLDKTFKPMEHMTLQCLAAREVAKSHETYREVLPRHIADFVELHTYGEGTPSYKQIKKLYLYEDSDMPDSFN